MLAQWITPQWFEGAMLVCFGAGWPVAILKTWRSKRTEGKSLLFLLLVFMGYLAGITAKLLRAMPAGEALEAVTLLYIVNAVLVGVDIALVQRYRRQAPVAGAIPTVAGGDDV